MLLNKETKQYKVLSFFCLECSIQMFFIGQTEAREITHMATQSIHEYV